jgi:hypothetical protein
MHTLEPIASPAINLAGLGEFTLFEDGSFAVGFPENKRMIRGRDVPYGASSSHADRDCKTQGHLRENADHGDPDLSCAGDGAPGIHGPDLIDP